MNFYLIFTFFISLVVLLGLKSKRFGILLLIFLFFMSAFRGEKVGNDTASYLDSQSIEYRGAILTNFATLEFDDLGQKVEIINNMVCGVIYYGGLDTRWLIYFYSFTTLFFLLLSFKRFKVSLPYGLVFYVLLGFYFYSMSAARQLTAVSILLYAYSFLLCQGNKRFLFFVWTLAATFIHSFSILFIPLYLVRYMPRPSQLYGLVVFLVSMLLVVVEVDFLSQLSISLDIEHMSDYVSEYGAGGQRNLFGKLESWTVVALMYYFYYRATKYPDVNRNKVMDNLYLFSMLFYASLSNYPGLIGRIHYDFSIIQCAYLAYYVGSMRRCLPAIDKLVYIVFVLLCMYINSSFENSLRSSYYLMF